MKFDLRKGFDSIKQPHVDYYRQYTYDQPMVMSVAQYEDTRALGLVLAKALRHMMDHFEDYLDILPRPTRDIEILKLYKSQPQHIGTFRTDFVIDEAGQIKIIEITTRQPLNGYFSTGFFRQIALDNSRGLGLEILDMYPAFYAFMQQTMGDADHVCVIRGSEKLEEFHLYPSIFEAAGIPCRVIPLADLAQNLSQLRNAWVISELTFAEIRSLPMAAVLALANSRAQNPLGSVLVSHDKRFFQALSEPRFLQAALSPTEQGLLEKYLVPTYGYGANPAAWAAAQANKDGYILKHMAKGKSVDVHAGCLTDEKEWQALFDRPAIADFVLQPMVRQKKFTGSIGAEIRADHSAGTLLYFNDAYFGPGLYRTSSSPVSGLADFRKMAPLVAKTDHKVDGCLYID